MKTNIPAAALNQHIAVLGKTGSGKTYAAKGIVEGLLGDKRQVCVLDPTSAWWGLRLAADGKRRGFDVVLLGGDHADIPLAEKSGAAVARLVTEQGASVVIDTGGMHVGQYTRWFIDFAGTLYTTIRNPLHLVIDEAHYFMPQGKVPDPDTGRMLHAGNRLMSGGRSRGIRGMLITQRPAKLHKDSLTCADTLIAMRVIAPQDRKAIKDWIDGAGEPEEGKQVIDSLAGLEKGDGWVWYPEGDYLIRVHFPAIKTYDSSAAPIHGEKGPQVAEIDLNEVKAALAEAVKEAEANDPKLLKSEIAKLEKELASKAPAPADEKAIERAKSAGRAEALRESAEAIKERDRIIGTLKSKMGKAERHISDGLGFLHVNGEATPKVVAPQPVAVARQAVPVIQRPRREPRESVEVGDVKLGKCERAVLTALYWLRDEEATQAKVAFYAGYSVTSSGFGNALSTLRTAGLLRGLRITSEGESLVESWDAGDKPTGQTLREWLRPKLGRCENTLLDTLCAAHPNTVPFGELSEQSGYSESSSGFGNALSTLRTIEAIEGYARDGGAKASDVFFE